MTAERTEVQRRLREMHFKNVETSGSSKPGPNLFTVDSTDLMYDIARSDKYSFEVLVSIDYMWMYSTRSESARAFLPIMPV